MTELMDYFRETGSIGGKKAAENMTADQRAARAKKASKAAAAARSKRAELGKTKKEARKK